MFCSSSVQLVDVPGFGAGGSSGALDAAGADAGAAPPLEGATRPTTVGTLEPLWAYRWEGDMANSANRNGKFMEIPYNSRIIKIQQKVTYVSWWDIGYVRDIVCKLS